MAFVPLERYKGNRLVWGEQHGHGSFRAWRVKECEEVAVYSVFDRLN